MNDRYRHTARPPLGYRAGRAARCLIAVALAVIVAGAVLAGCAVTAGLLWLKLLGRVG